MKIQDLMTTSVRACGSEDSLNEAARFMWEGDCGCLPVIDADRHVIGMITDRDVAMAAYMKGQPLREIPVSSAMTRAVIALHSKDELATAADRMCEAAIRRMPVVDDDNRPLGPGKIGELALKGPSRSAGYFNDPQATADAADGEGWFHTGDLARVDEEGYFTIVDRKKDMFISGGENVYPAEIEAALYRHPAVHLCAVIGVPDAKWGEVGLACVVLKANVQAGPAELLAFLRDNLARYKVPRRVEILDALPLSGAGKVLKRELHERFSH